MTKYFQHWTNTLDENLSTLVITNALQYRELPIYGTGINIRDWIHVDDHCNGILSALEKGTRGNVYNLGGNNELTNITIVKMILSILNRPISLIQYVKDRPGHDLRYSINSSKAQLQLQWNPQKSFTSGLEETVGWYKKNRKWWENIKDKEFENYYKNQYESKLR